MQFLAKSARPLLTPRARQQSWVLSQSTFSTKSKAKKSESKPATIPYQPQLSNAIDLVGYVIKPLQFHDDPNGIRFADSVISHQSSSDPESKSELDSYRKFRIPIRFEGDVANTAESKLKKDDRIRISGHIFMDASPEKEYIQITVNDFHHVESSKAPSQVLPESDSEEVLAKHYEPVIDKVSPISCKPGEESWMDLVQNMNKWWDNRLGKKNPKSPDFKHKETGVALWLNTSPRWVVEKLPPPKSNNASKGDEESWKDLLANQSKWWDNRVDKKFPNGADFAHKETRVKLYLKDCPSWVMEKLPPPKSKA